MTTDDKQDWSIDHTAGRPILVYQNCSVIEAEQAEYVLRLIEADKLRGAGEPVAWRIRHRSEPGMVGHYPWTYVGELRRAKHYQAHENYDVEPMYAAPQASAEVRKPDGYAYRYHDGVRALRFNSGELINGCRPFEAVPYYLRTAPAADDDQLRKAIQDCWLKVIKSLAAIVNTRGPESGFDTEDEAIYRSPVMDQVVSIRQAHDELNRALKSAPAAEDSAKGAGDEGPTSKQAWWAGYRAGKGLPPDTPRQNAVTATLRCAKCGEQANVSISSAKIVTHRPDGTPRDERDIASDPEGKLIHDPAEPLIADRQQRGGDAKPTNWQDAQAIVDNPTVDEALANFSQDSTHDNAVGLVHVILDAIAQQGKEGQ